METGEAALCPQIPFISPENTDLQQPAPVIRPVEMKPLPFYDVLDVLLKPSSLGATTTQRGNQEEHFILKAEQVRKLFVSREFLPGGRKIYNVQIQLRFCLSERSCPQEDSYPSGLGIKVNGKVFRLPGYARPPKNGMEQKSPGRPLNITSLIKHTSSVRNTISVTWAPEIGKIYSMSVYLVRQLTSRLVLQRLRMKGTSNPDHSRALIKEKLTADPDSEIAIASLRVSLMCPLGKMRLTVPCRAVTCSHLQCFDAALYLQMNEKKPTWLCPVCDKKATYESLIIDGLFLEILNDCSDVDEIEFQEDGTWFPMKPRKEALKIPTQSVSEVDTPLRQPSVARDSTEPSYTKRADVIDLTIESSSSDDEEDKNRPPKKRNISKNEEMHAKGVLTYLPTVQVPNVQAPDPPHLNSALADYAVPFHPSASATIPTDMQRPDLFSLIQTNPEMFLRILQNAAAATSSSALVSSSSSHYDAISHAASSLHETGVVTGGEGSRGGEADGDISDNISLD
ncbi:E3 SUMO-protein ligase PIAS2-like [Pelmatolapia mariae]|uniref:E3 SUMO-protein ligase PIAS2-like n=1 Tax=Pelmatolapia mariae TaxID=158779 RepID=UPI002FE68072